MDGAMFNTRQASDGSTWRENKLGAVFRNNDIVYRKTKTGRDAHRIMEREFISYAGDADTFKEHLYAVALKHGLEHAAEVVIISDGAKWIKGFREKFCSNLKVVHILDYTHVKENIYKSPTYSSEEKNRKLLGLNSWLNWSRKGKSTPRWRWLSHTKTSAALGFRIFTTTSRTIETALTIRLI